MFTRSSTQTLTAVLLASALAAGCDSGGSQKTYAAPEGHDGQAHGRVVPVEVDRSGPRTKAGPMTRD